MISGVASCIHFLSFVSSRLLNADVVIAIGSPIPQTLYPFLAVPLLIVGLVVIASFFMVLGCYFCLFFGQEFISASVQLPVDDS
ncbi:hypothetical protein CY35_13G116000 [Sphagnum magellanicum]|nr:hypothetical protein CY35_13G116000 [Sphagnum magellanicum]